MGNIKDVNINTGNLRIKIEADRLNKNLMKAADFLGESILKDSTKFVPLREGVLRNSGHVEAAGVMGEVIWNTPYAHYQYEGIVYVGEETGSPFAKFGEHKIPAVPNKPLTYATAGTGDHWFEKAKEEYGDTWIKKVKEIAGDG